MKIQAPHFGVKCPCGMMAVFPISPGDVDEDFAVLLHALSEKDRKDLRGFWEQHAAHGDMGPCVVDIRPLELKPDDVA